MKERTITAYVPVIPNHQPPEVPQPREGPFHLPPTSVTTQLPAILRLWLYPIGPVRTDQLNAFVLEPPAKRVRIRRTIINQPRHPLPGTPGPFPRHRHLLQRCLYQRHFPRRRRVEMGCQRNSLAACHHHPLCTLSAFGLSDAEAPFFAGAKLPSAKHSSQSRRCKASNSPSRVRQALSHTPASSHSSRRRLQVEYEGYSLGRSFQRAPERRTQRMPSKQSRLEAGGRPPLEDFLAAGNSGAIFDHCSSLSVGLFIGDSFRRRVNHKLLHGANLYSWVLKPLLSHLSDLKLLLLHNSIDQEIA